MLIFFSTKVTEKIKIFKILQNLIKKLQQGLNIFFMILIQKTIKCH